PLRPEPLSVPHLWGTPPRQSCLWQPPLSPVSAAYNPAVARTPPGQTATRAARPAHWHPSYDLASLHPPAPTPRVPRDAAGVCHGPHAAGHGRRVHRDGPPGVHRCPAPLGQATAVPPSHP